MNKKLLKKAPLVLIPALISASMLCSCAGAFATTSPEETGTIASTVVKDVSETTTTTVTEVTTETTTESTTVKVEVGTTSDNSDTTKRKSITDLFTTFNFTRPAGEIRTNPNGTVDFSCFDNCAFVGNSRLLSAESYGYCDNVYAKVGLTVDTVFTESCSGSSKVVIDELKGKRFDKVFLMFGDNECGWENMNIFRSRYLKVIEAVRDRIPNAKIYLISVLPISKAESDKNSFGCNMGSIARVNDVIKDLAQEQGVEYVDAASAITNSEGYLPDDASPDGCHLGKKYTRLWLEYTAKNM